MYKLRKPTKEDLDEVFELLKRTWCTTYPDDEYGISEEDILDHYADKEERIQRWSELYDNPGYRNFLVVEDEYGKIVGQANFSNEPGKYEIGAIYVLPEYQGQGIGKLLMNKIFEELAAEDIFLEMASYNRRTKEFYEHLGFAEVQGYYSEFPLRNGKKLPIIKMIRKRTK